jgi:hypothetical protein
MAESEEHAAPFDRREQLRRLGHGKHAQRPVRVDRQGLTDQEQALRRDEWRKARRTGAAVGLPLSLSSGSVPQRLRRSRDRRLVNRATSSARPASSRRRSVANAASTSGTDWSPARTGRPPTRSPSSWWTPNHGHRSHHPDRGRDRRRRQVDAAVKVQAARRRCALLERFRRHRRRDFDRRLAGRPCLRRHLQRAAGREGPVVRSGSRRHQRDHQCRDQADGRHR